MNSRVKKTMEELKVIWAENNKIINNLAKEMNDYFGSPDYQEILEDYKQKSEAIKNFAWTNPSYRQHLIKSGVLDNTNIIDYVKKKTKELEQDFATPTLSSSKAKKLREEVFNLKTVEHDMKKLSKLIDEKELALDNANTSTILIECLEDAIEDYPNLRYGLCEPNKSICFPEKTAEFLNKALYSTYVYDDFKYNQVMGM